MDSFSFILRDRLSEHLATDEEGLGETGQQERYSAHPQVPLFNVTALLFTIDPKFK